VEIHVFQELAQQVGREGEREGLKEKEGGRGGKEEGPEGGREGYPLRHVFILEIDTHGHGHFPVVLLCYISLEQALAACNESLLAGAKVLREQKGDLDADLFLVRLSLLISSYQVLLAWYSSSCICPVVVRVSFNLLA
jgi:hypothetical protein